MLQSKNRITCKFQPRYLQVTNLSARFRFYCDWINAIHIKYPYSHSISGTFKSKSNKIWLNLPSFRGTPLYGFSQLYWELLLPSAISPSISADLSFLHSLSFCKTSQHPFLESVAMNFKIFRGGWIFWHFLYMWHLFCDEFFMFTEER